VGPRAGLDTIPLLTELNLTQTAATECFGREASLLFPIRGEGCLLFNFRPRTWNEVTYESLLPLDRYMRGQELILGSFHSTSLMLPLNYDVTLRSMEFCSNNRRGLLGP
jgi:hypothetical protein